MSILYNNISTEDVDMSVEQIRISDNILTLQENVSYNTIYILNNIDYEDSYDEDEGDIGCSTIQI